MVEMGSLSTRDFVGCGSAQMPRKIWAVTRDRVFQLPAAGCLQKEEVGHVWIGVGRDQRNVGFEKAKQSFARRAGWVGANDGDGLVFLHLLDLEEANAFPDLGPKSESIVDPFAINRLG